MSFPENNVYTALRPIQILSNLFGFSAKKSMDAKRNKIDIFLVIHVGFTVLLKVFLICYNLDPSKFKNATNSAILNSGLWIQTEASLIISILYIGIGVSKSSDMWKLIHEFHEIDQEFSKSFFIKYHYLEARRWILLFVVSAVTIHFILVVITAYYIWDLPFEHWHKLSVLVSIYVSNICIYSIANQYLCALLNLSSRFQNVNDILSQLIFDEPISDSILLMDNKVASDDATFAMQKNHRAKNIYKSNSKSGIMFINSPDAVQINYPFEKEFPRVITLSSGATSDTTVKLIKAKFTPFSLVAYKTSIKKLAFTRSSSIADKSNKLNKLIELHDRLCDCVDLCNYLLAVQVLLISLTIFVYIAQLTKVFFGCPILKIQYERCPIIFPSDVRRKTLVNWVVFGLFAKFRFEFDFIVVIVDYIWDVAEVFHYMRDQCVMRAELMSVFKATRVWMDYQHEAGNVAQMNIYWIVAYSIFIVLGTHVSSGLMKTVQKTAIMIHKIACRNENFVLLNKLSRISQMLHSRKISVGCGLIAFDWSTIFTLFGSVCMYLIILIQFFISAKSNKIQQLNASN